MRHGTSYGSKHQQPGLSKALHLGGCRRLLIGGQVLRVLALGQTLTLTVL